MEEIVRKIENKLDQFIDEFNEFKERLDKVEIDQKDTENENDKKDEVNHVENENKTVEKNEINHVENEKESVKKYEIKHAENQLEPATVKKSKDEFKCDKCAYITSSKIGLKTQKTKKKQALLKLDNKSSVHVKSRTF